MSAMSVRLLVNNAAHLDYRDAFGVGVDEIEAVTRGYQSLRQHTCVDARVADVRHQLGQTPWDVTYSNDHNDHYEQVYDLSR